MRGRPASRDAPAPSRRAVLRGLTIASPCIGGSGRFGRDGTKTAREISGGSFDSDLVWTRARAPAHDTWPRLIGAARHALSTILTVIRTVDARGAANPHMPLMAQREHSLHHSLAPSCFGHLLAPAVEQRPAMLEDLIRSQESLGDVSWTSRGSTLADAGSAVGWAE